MPTTTFRVRPSALPAWLTAMLLVLAALFPRPEDARAQPVRPSAPPTQGQVQPGPPPVRQPPVQAQSAVPGAQPKKAESSGVALPGGVERVTSVEGVTEYRLAGNGMRVLLVPDPTTPSITINVTYLVGSRNENYGETGMAHLLEHLMFKGTPTHPDLSEEFRKRGVRWNASTSYDRTNYFETFAAAGDNLEWALRVEADRMLNSFIARKDLDSEMTVVRNEMESGENNPTRILYQRMLSVAYEWHNYGKATIGARADVENVDIPRLQAFYRQYYQPDNAVLIIGGRFDEAKTLALVAQVFGVLPKPARTIERTYTIEAVQDGERQVILRRTADIQHLALLYHTVPAASADYVPLSAMVEILSGTPSGRLHKALVETRKATSVSGWVRDTREPGHAMFMAAVGRNDSLDEVERIMIDVVEKSGSQPVTREELERFKVATAKDYEQVIASPDSLVGALSEAAADGDWRLFFVQRDAAEKLTAEQVQQAAARYFKRSNRTTGLFIPTDQPERAPAPAFVDASRVVEGYQGRAEMAAGEAFDPTPENIEKRVQRLTLANGTKLVLLPKKTRGEIVNARLQLHFGDLKSLEGKREVGQLAGSMLMRGTRNKSREQIRDAFDQLRTEASIGGGAEGASATLVSKRENLVAALRLAAEVLREPSFPEAEFEQLKKQLLTGIEAQRREPGPVAGQAVRSHFNVYPPADVRYSPSFDEQTAAVQAIGRDQVAAFHRDYYGAQQAELSVIGDFDVEQVKALAAELFGGWNARHTYTRVPVPYPDVKATAFALETPDKANSVLIGAASLPLRDDDSDAMAAMLANFLLGGSETSRMWIRLREKEGFSYDVRSGLLLNAFEPNSSWSVSAIFAPAVRDKLLAALREEVERAQRDGFTDAEVDSGRKGLLERRRLARTDDGALTSALAALSHRGRTAAFLGENDAKIAKLTTAEVNAALRKYLRFDVLTTAVAGDFKK